MSNSTPQGPGPRFGSNPDATPIDEQAALQRAMDQEAAAVDDRADATDPIDISADDGPQLTVNVDDIDPGSD